MLRLRLTLAKDQPLVCYTHFDLLHDALINALTQAGAQPEQLIGPRASAWTFAPLGYRSGHLGKAHTLVVSTADSALASVLTRIRPEQVAKRRGPDHSVSFEGADVRLEADPVLPGQNALACLMLSPLVLQSPASDGKKKRWQTTLNQCGDLNERINRRLSHVAQRPVALQLSPDALYLRANPKHSVLVNLKTFKNGAQSYVIGMQAPMTMQGSEEDLRLAWYAGIGEKTRSGFGCLGLASEGIGR